MVIVLSVYGSSPRVRGKHGRQPLHVKRRRIIPARAGQTPIRSRPARTCPDHPRACGANPLALHCLFPIHGSSPRVRGKQHTRVRSRNQPRIIPARAGQTRHLRRRVGTCPDHPRACGANGEYFIENNGAYGSSPRVRGKLPSALSRSRLTRIIPARAGQTSAVSGPFPAATDHPRACGANLMYSLALTPAVGSSPRVRGKPRLSLVHSRQQRIIPARAGQTSCTRWR